MLGVVWGKQPGTLTREMGCWMKELKFFGLVLVLTERSDLFDCMGENSSDPPGYWSASKIIPTYCISSTEVPRLDSS